MFLVIEIQTTTEDQVSSLVYPYATENEALSKYHNVLSYAAVNNNLKKHACAIFTEEGFYLKHECYIHEQPAPEPEPQTEPEGE